MWISIVRKCQEQIVSQRQVDFAEEISSWLGEMFLQRLKGGELEHQEYELI